VKPDPVRAIADAVLYEGYILWPYRRSALKNQRRFTFGGVFPPAHSADHPDDPDTMRTEVLLRGGPQTSVEVAVRFLQVVRRTVLRRCGDRLEAVDELTVGGVRHLSWEEAVEREIKSPRASLQALREPAAIVIEIAEGQKLEEPVELQAHGALLRSWHRLQGELRVSAALVAEGLWRVAVEVVNTTLFDGDSRPRALEQTLCSTHTMLKAHAGEFVSLTSPPAELTPAAEACRNQGTWPVLVGEPEERSTILSSPIILEDHPRIAPESPGDLFDGGEIDQLLILNILTLTDEEKAEMAATDPRAREILERTEALSPEQLMALHGTIREFGLVRP
jgi:muconolactone delta-isomerase